MIVSITTPDPGSLSLSYCSFGPGASSLDPVEQALLAGALNDIALIHTARALQITKHRRPRRHTHDWTLAMAVGSVLRHTLRRDDGSLHRIPFDGPAIGSLSVCDIGELRLLPRLRTRTELRIERCRGRHCNAERRIVHTVSVDPLEQTDGLAWLEAEVISAHRGAAAMAELLNRADEIDPERRGGVFDVAPDGSVSRSREGEHEQP